MSDRSIPHPLPAAEAPTSDRVRDMFSAITPVYDRLNHLFSGNLDRRWRRRAAETALEGLADCRRVLDVATGTGDLAHALRDALDRRHWTNARVHAADFTRPMLRRAAEKFTAGRLHWAEADGLRLPFAGESFDALTIAFGLRNMDGKPAALLEMLRVLRPGGRLVILEFSQPANRFYRAFYDFYSLRVMPRVGYWISGSPAYLYLARSIRHFWTADRLADEMRAAGFAEVQAIPLFMGTVFLHRGIRPQ